MELRKVQYFLIPKQSETFLQLEKNSMEVTSQLEIKMNELKSLGFEDSNFEKIKQLLLESHPSYRANRDKYNRTRIGVYLADLKPIFIIYDNSDLTMSSLRLHLEDKLKSHNLVKVEYFSESAIYRISDYKSVETMISIDQFFEEMASYSWIMLGLCDKVNEQEGTHWSYNA